LDGRDFLQWRLGDVLAFDELRELQNIVERGPNWNTIDRIVVTLNRPSIRPARENKPWACSFPNVAASSAPPANGRTRTTTCADGKVGRILEEGSRFDPPELRWAWSITSIWPAPKGVTSGTAATRDEAIIKFRAASEKARSCDWSFSL
jgi:hypothetical protein